MYGWNRFFALDLQYRDWQFRDAFGTLALLPACDENREVPASPM